MYKSEGRATLIEIIKDIEVLKAHKRHIEERQEVIEARIGIKSSIIGERIQESKESDKKIIEYINEKTKTNKEKEEIEGKIERLEREREEIEGILKGSKGEDKRVIEWYYIDGLSGYEIEYRTWYSKSQIYRIIGRYKRGDKKGLKR